MIIKDSLLIENSYQLDSYQTDKEFNNVEEYHYKICLNTNNIIISPEYEENEKFENKKIFIFCNFDPNLILNITFTSANSLNFIKKNTFDISCVKNTIKLNFIFKSIHEKIKNTDVNKIKNNFKFINRIEENNINFILNFHCVIEFEDNKKINLENVNELKINDELYSFCSNNFNEIFINSNLKKIELIDMKLNTNQQIYDILNFIYKNNCEELILKDFFIELLEIDNDTILNYFEIEEETNFIYFHHNKEPPKKMSTIKKFKINNCPLCLLIKKREQEEINIEIDQNSFIYNNMQIEKYKLKNQELSFDFDADIELENEKFDIFEKLKELENYKIDKIKLRNYSNKSEYKKINFNLNIKHLVFDYCSPLFIENLLNKINKQTFECLSIKHCYVESLETKKFKIFKISDNLSLNENFKLKISDSFIDFLIEEKETFNLKTLNIKLISYEEEAELYNIENSNFIKDDIIDKTNISLYNLIACPKLKNLELKNNSLIYLKKYWDIEKLFHIEKLIINSIDLNGSIKSVYIKEASMFEKEKNKDLKDIEKFFDIIKNLTENSNNNLNEIYLKKIYANVDTNLFKTDKKMIIDYESFNNIVYYNHNLENFENFFLMIKYKKEKIEKKIIESINNIILFLNEKNIIIECKNKFEYSNVLLSFIAVVKYKLNYDEIKNMSFNFQKRKNEIDDKNPNFICLNPYLFTREQKIFMNEFNNIILIEKNN
jgi:hypothetical protein